MNIAIKNVNGINENIVVVRYFQFNGANYLIFTKNEVDESGYQKLYISKIVNMVGNSIVDEVEWNLLRDTIKVIAKANKENTTLPVQDLNEMEINGLQITGEKPFKLTSASVALLSANKANNKHLNLNNVNNVISSPSIVPSNSQPGFSMDAVASSFAVPVNNASTSTISAGIPNNADNATMNINSLQVDNTQNLNSPVLPNSGIESMNSFAGTGANPNLVLNSIPSVPTSVSVSNIEPQNVVPINGRMNVNFNDNGVSENTVGTNLQQNLYSDLQMPNSPIMDNVANLNDSTPNFEPAAPAEPVIDYKKLYEEQILKLNAITVELEKYKNIIEQLKNILS